MIRCPSTFFSMRLVTETLHRLSSRTSSEWIGNSTFRGLPPEMVGRLFMPPDLLNESMSGEPPPSHLASAFILSPCPSSFMRRDGTEKVNSSFPCGPILNGKMINVLSRILFVKRTSSERSFGETETLTFETPPISTR